MKFLKVLLIGMILFATSCKESTDGSAGGGKGGDDLTVGGKGGGGGTGEKCTINDPVSYHKYTTAELPYMSQYEVDAFNEVNEARVNPCVYALKHVQPVWDKMPDSEKAQAKPGTNSFALAVKTALDELLPMAPLAEYKPDLGLVITMRAHLSNPSRINAHHSSVGGNLDNSMTIANLYSEGYDPNFPDFNSWTPPAGYPKNQGNYDYFKFYNGTGGGGEAIQNGIRPDCRGLNAGRTFVEEWVIDNVNEGTNWGHRHIVLDKGAKVAGFAMGNTSNEYKTLTGIPRDAGLVISGTNSLTHKDYAANPALIANHSWKPTEITWNVPSSMDVTCPAP